jgi:hypothetical protein
MKLSTNKKYCLNTKRLYRGLICCFSVLVLPAASMLSFASDYNDKSIKEISDTALSVSSDGVIPAKAMYVSTVNGYSARSKLDKNGALPVISKFGSLENTNENSVVREAIKKAQTEEQFSAQQTMSFNGIPTGDFNGDGCNDNVTLNSSSIVISHPCGGSNTTYNFSGSYAINGVYDTDGEAGLEIGVVNGTYFQIIDDADKRLRRYTMGNNWAINGNYELDGDAGNEIGVVSQNYLVIIDDAQNKKRNYLLGNNWAINGNYDADGNTGDEIGIVNSLYFQILTDAVNNITNYSLGNSYSINGSYDTDGEPGVELGIVKSGFFDLLDDEDNNIRSYGIPGAYFVNGAQNIDGQAGKEILINNYGNNQNATIYDAINQIIFN